MNSLDEELGQEITLFLETAKKMKEDYVEELSSPDREDDDAALIDSSNLDSDVQMVGNPYLFTGIREYLLRRMRPDDMCFCSFLGEDGCGIRLIARTIFEDLSDSGNSGKQFFDCCAWVKIGTKHDQLKEVLMGIIAQLDNLSAAESELLISREEEELRSCLRETLENQRFMIFLDDIRDLKAVDYLREILPDQSDGSIVCITTASKEVAELIDGLYTIEVPPYRDFVEAMWASLRGLLFGSESISAELEEAGKKIVENCGGIVVSATKTLLYLIKTATDMTVEHWRKVAEDRENPIFMVEDELSEMSKIELEVESYDWDVDDERRKAILHWITEWIYLPGFVKHLKMRIHPERFFSRMQILSLYGMAGIGKSTLTRKIYEDTSIVSYFDHHVWVTLGPKYRSNEILVDVLAKIYPDIDKLHMKEDENLARELCGKLSSKRCLIVLDDLWSKEPFHCLKYLFPDIKGTTLVTTRLAKVAKFGQDDLDYEMQLLDKEESWCLLLQRVFGGGPCPYELEKVGRKIVEKCEGLPLLILAVADQLLKIEISEECWNNVVSGKEKSVFINAHRQISKVLLPSYRSLSQNLKPFFLYMGVFREKYKVSMSNLTNLLISEGFLKPDSPQLVEDFIAECLCELVDSSLVMVERKVSPLRFKTCCLHPVFWHLSNGEAVKNNFFHAMNIHDDCSLEIMKSQRRLCIRNNILLGMKDVQKSIEFITRAHSLLCVGPFHQYPVPLNFDLRLLRVMNALTIRLYEFPVEVVRLVHLRYLGLTCNGNLPTSIAGLWKLQYLIVKQYTNIKSPQNCSLLPKEIWDMKELKHLQIMGGYLPDHERGAGLLNLSALLDVSVQSCREEVLKWIPLGIRIELPPNDEGNSFHYLNIISGLQGLESFKCVVVNPRMRSEVVPPILMFPPSLKKLSLSGLGYPWKYMSTIYELENLEVLKLKSYAFQGPAWEMDFTNHFKKLKFLLAEDTNLVRWKVKSAIATELKWLCIKNCYKLQELPIPFYIHRLKKIEIVDCSPFTVAWAEQTIQTLVLCEVKVHLSWLFPIKNDAW